MWLSHSQQANCAYLRTFWKILNVECFQILNRSFEDNNETKNKESRQDRLRNGMEMPCTIRTSSEPIKIHVKLALSNGCSTSAIVLFIFYQLNKSKGRNLELSQHLLSDLMNRHKINTNHASAAFHNKLLNQQKRIFSPKNKYRINHIFPITVYMTE